MVMEYCPGGSLYDLLGRKKLSEGEVLSLFQQVCEAVEQLHGASGGPIAHRDIKAENVLLARDGTAKLCDFGSATRETSAPSNERERKAVEEDLSANTNLVYRAPEMLDLYSGHAITHKTDIWALGCLLYCLMFGRHPFDQKLGIINGRYELPEFHPYGPELIALLRDLLVVDPNNRPGIYDILERVARLRGVPCPVARPGSQPKPTGATSAAATTSQRHQQQQQQQQQAPPLQRNSSATVLAMLDWYSSDSGAPVSAPAAVGGAAPPLAAAPAAVAPAPAPVPAAALLDLDWNTSGPTLVPVTPAAAVSSAASSPATATRSASDLLLFSDFVSAPSSAPAASPAAELFAPVTSSSAPNLLSSVSPSPTPSSPTPNAANLFAEQLSSPPRSSSTALPQSDLLAQSQSSAKPAVAPLQTATSTPANGGAYGSLSFFASAPAQATRSASSSDLLAVVSSFPSPPPAHTQPLSLDFSSFVSASSAPAAAAAAPGLQSNGTGAPPAEEFPLLPLSSTPQSLSAEEINKLISELVYLRKRVRELELAKK
jgi:serine/threonine protein kinase